MIHFTTVTNKVVPVQITGEIIYMKFVGQQIESQTLHIFIQDNIFICSDESPKKFTEVIKSHLNISKTDF